jgi:nitroreductase
LKSGRVIYERRTDAAMETVMDIIKKRRSIRKYQDRPVPEDVVNAVLEAAKHAPSARNLQPLEYKVVSSKALMDKLSEALVPIMQSIGIPLKIPPDAKPDFFRGAPLLIIVTAPKDNVFGATEAGLAVQNIMLYATSIGLGTCFIGMVREITSDKNLLEMLHITENMSVVAGVVCGYPDESPEPKEKKLKAEFFA